MSDTHKEAARLRGEARSADVASKVRKAMITIQAEMAANNGIYPANGGAISMNEVARRAGISETTLFAPKQKELGKQVKDWVESLKNKEVVGRMRVRRSIFERSEDWRNKYLALQDSHIATELDLQDTNVKLQEAQQSLTELNKKYEALLDQMRSKGSQKVIAIPKSKI